MKKFFKNLTSMSFWRHNTLAKVICLILGIIAWFYVMDNQNPVVTNTFSNMPVEILGREQIENQNLIIGTIENEQVDVSVTGPWKNIMALSEKDISLTATLSGTTKGTVSTPIEVRVADSNVSVTLSEKIMRVELDAIEIEKRDVRVSLTGEPPEGVVIGDLVQKQEQVSVEGPSKQLKFIAYVEAVGAIGDETTSFTSFMQLTPKNDKGEVVEGVEVVEPFLEVDVPFIITKTVPVNLVFTQNFGDKYKLGSSDVNPKEVTLRGEKTIIDKITTIPTREYVLASSNPTVEQRLQLIIPADVTADNDHVTASFTVDPVETRTFNFLPKDITILNQVETLKYEFDVEDVAIQVEIRDSRENLVAIQQADIKLSIDVSGLVSGRWATPIKLEGLPAGTTSTINPTAIPVNISDK